VNDFQVSRCGDRGVKGSRVRVTRSASSQAIRRNHQRSMLKHYKDLNVWQKSYELCLKIYRITAKFPNEERYGLTSQTRRSAVSIPSPNIAEGYGRKTTVDYIRMLYISYGSVCELETQILLAGDLGYIEKGELGTAKKDIAEIERMLKALITSLENKHLNP
jgi:four helix bundle protein